MFFSIVSLFLLNKQNGIICVHKLNNCKPMKYKSLQTKYDQILLNAYFIIGKCIIIIIIIFIVTIIIKKIGNPGPRHSDRHPISPATPALQYQPTERK